MRLKVAEGGFGLLIAYEFRDMRCKNLCFYGRIFHIRPAGRDMFKTNQKEEGQARGKT